MGGRTRGGLTSPSDLLLVRRRGAALLRRFVLRKQSGALQYFPKGAIAMTNYCHLKTTLHQFTLAGMVTCGVDNEFRQPHGERQMYAIGRMTNSGKARRPQDWQSIWPDSSG